MLVISTETEKNKQSEQTLIIGLTKHLEATNAIIQTVPNVGHCLFLSKKEEGFMAEPILHIEGLDKKIGSKQILKQISMDVMEGEIIGLLGRMVPEKQHSSVSSSGC